MIPDIWYVDALPVDLCTVVQKRTQLVDWFIALMDNLKEQGMISPILVHNQEKKPYYIRCGNNRVEAVRILGWTHVKALCWGIKPSDDLNPVKLNTLEECQAYLADGTLEYRPDEPRNEFFVAETIPPEHMKYPEAKDT